MKTYLWNLIVSLDQTFLNVLLSPLWNKFTPLKNFGAPDETLSSAMGKNIEKGVCMPCHLVCKILSRLELKHCTKSIEDDEGVID